jgi:TonB-dependent receptor-like protein
VLRFQTGGRARARLLVASVPTALLPLSQHPALGYDALTLSEVVVTAPPIGLVAADTASQGVVGPRQLQEFPTYREGETLETVPGLTVTQLATVYALQSELTGTTVPQAKTPFLTKAVGYEVGVRSEILPHLSATAALFVLDLDSEATFNGDQANTTAGRPSNTHGRGAHRHLCAPALAVFQRRYRLYARAGFSDADDGSGDVEPGHPGNHIPLAAKVIAAAEMTVHDLGAWDGGLRFRYFGPRPMLEDGSVRSGPIALFDARLGYRLTETLHLGLDVFNLYNSHAHQIDYFYPSQLANETSPVFDTHFKPFEPLSFRFTLAAAF